MESFDAGHNDGTSYRFGITECPESVKSIACFVKSKGSPVISAQSLLKPSTGMLFTKPFLYRVVLLCMLLTGIAHAQPTFEADSWQQVLKNKKGTVTAFWYEIEPFIYTNENGQLEGVEYEIMESLRSYLLHKYGIELTINWVNAGSFENVYEQVKQSSRPGIFGWSFYSITLERKKEVQFTLPYMPDLNVVVTHNSEPVYTTSQELVTRLKDMRGYTMANTTMEEDIELLRNNFYTPLRIIRQEHDYMVMKNIETDRRGLGYVPLSVYIVGLQKGIKVKRQHVLTSRREGFAGVLPINSDWKELMDSYFKSIFFLTKANTIINKYLGSDVKELVFGNGRKDSLKGNDNGLELVTLEKEIVTKRLMDTALEVQRQRSFRNTVLLVLIFFAVLAISLYARFRTKQRLNRELEQQNRLISKQNEQIEQMNQLLKLKVLQARMNPHFLFNSLNSIQYFITADDKRISLQYINRFSAFLRKVINFGDELSISVNDEAELLKEYLWLEHTRFPNQFDYEIKLPGNMQQLRILPLLTHGLVEAALYKGVLNLGDGKKGKIVIDFTAGSGMLFINVRDNGMSRQASGDLERKKGLVAAEEDMLARRIKLFNRQGKKKISLNLQADKIGMNETVNQAHLAIPQPLFD
jgi:ABC-type amino acid transport substrate-binding protein